MKKKYRIGVYRNAGSGWHGGQIYFDNLIELLSNGSNEPVELVIIEKERGSSKTRNETTGMTVFLSDYRQEVREKEKEHRREAKRRRQKKWWHRFFREARMGEMSKSDRLEGGNSPELAAFEKIASDHLLDFIFPLPAAAYGSNVKGAGWIPDLQHCFLPELFTPTEIETRNKMFRKFSEAGLIVFSSETSRNEFRSQFPDAMARLAVWSFCSNLGNNLFTVEPSLTVEKYRLPKRFFLVANQFWKHKDHGLVVEALTRLKEEGHLVPVVFTGALRDYRGTGHVDQLLQSIQSGGINDTVHLLGFLEREEQLHLMRSALAVIQPSRFEGWSTVVEDCKAMGQRMILSDLAVHREQDPPNSVFFPVGDSNSLAEKIREVLADSPADWIAARESRESQARLNLTQAKSEARIRFLELVKQSEEDGTETMQKTNT